MFCTKCGNELKENDLYCGICGEKNKAFSQKIKVVQKKEEKINSLIQPNVIITMVFGVLLLSVFIIFLLSLFTHGGDDAFSILM